MTREWNPDDFRVDIGRAGQGKTFVRVVHLATGKDRVVVGLEGANSDKVATRLTEELAREIDAERLGPHPLPDIPGG